MAKVGPIWGWISVVLLAPSDLWAQPYKDPKVCYETRIKEVEGSGSPESGVFNSTTVFYDPDKGVVNYFDSKMGKFLSIPVDWKSFKASLKDSEKLAVSQLGDHIVLSKMNPEAEGGFSQSALLDMVNVKTGQSSRDLISQLDQEKKLVYFSEGYLNVNPKIDPASYMDPSFEFPSLQMIDISSGQATTVEVYDKITCTIESSTPEMIKGEPLIYVNGKGEIRHLKKTGPSLITKSKPLGRLKDNESCVHSAGPYGIIVDKSGSGSARMLNLKTGQSIKVPAPALKSDDEANGYYNSVKSAGPLTFYNDINGKTHYFNSQTGEIKATGKSLDIENWFLSEIKGSDSIFLTPSPNIEGDPKAIVIDASTGEIGNAGFEECGSTRSDDDEYSFEVKKEIFYKRNGDLYVLDKKSPRKGRLVLPDAEQISCQSITHYNSEKNKIYLSGYGKLLEVGASEQLCIPDSKSWAFEFTQQCEYCISSKGVFLSSPFTWVSDFREKQICSEDYDPKSWNDYLKSDPVDMSGKQAISNAAVRKRLLRMHKKFIPNQDTQLLHHLLKAKAEEKFPDLMAGALQSVAMDHPEIYKKLDRRFSDLEEVFEKASINPNFCRSESESARLAERAEERIYSLSPSISVLTDDGSSKQVTLKELFEGNYPETSKSYPQMAFDQWAWELAPLKGILNQFPEAQKDNFIDFIAETIRSTGIDQYGEEIFSPKIYYLAADRVGTFFGRSSEVQTDLSLSGNSADRVKLTILSSRPITDSEGKGGDISRSLGFYMEERVLTRYQIQDGNVSWKTGGKTYQPDFKLITLDDSKIRIPQSEPNSAPNKKEIYKNGKRTIAIITSANLSGDKEGSGDDTLEYGFVNGYIPVGQPELIEDPKAYIQQAIESGEWDAMADQSHSGGTEWKAMILPKQLNKVVLRRTNAKGEIDEIVSLFPVKREYSHENTTVSHQEFGQWIQQRETKGSEEFTHIPVSCSSERRLKHMMPHINSPIYKPFPTGQTVHFFSNQGSNDTYKVIDGWMENKDYTDIAEEVDRYHVPGSARYTQFLESSRNSPIQVEYRLIDENGKEVVFGE
tara:strand:+ start:234568 stop:237786 length:3219 start_codon:yes stop_codon:yes gene_type:complete